MEENSPWPDFHVSDVQDKESEEKKELKSASISVNPQPEGITRARWEYPELLLEITQLLQF